MKLLISIKNQIRNKSLIENEKIIGKIMNNIIK